MAFIPGRKRNKKKTALSVDQQFKKPEELLGYATQQGIETDPLDVAGVAGSLGIRLRYEAMSEEASGRLERSESGTWYMYINSLHHPNRQRFTIAHEIAHRFLHGDMQEEFDDKIFFRNGEQTSMETEANRYAASLLMPQESFRNFVANSSSKVEDIAKHFGVSSLAVRYRASALGYSGHGV